MHGMPRPKPGASQDPSKMKKKQAKAALYGRLAGEVLKRRIAKQYDEESMQLSARLLELNPEVYTIWNYRREYLGPVLSRQTSSEARSALAAELAITEKALAVNQKSYAAWHHRGWAVVTGGADLQNELALVHKLLSLDSRNFHGWAYWRWLAARMQLSTAASLEYTAQHLRQNFSNYSAWHARSLLLTAAAQEPRVATLAELLARDSQPAFQHAQSASMHAASSAAQVSSAHAALPATAAIPASVLDEEFEMTHRAFWTEPKDQSAWLYHRWLLGCCLAAAGVSSTGGHHAVHEANVPGAGDTADSAARNTLVRRLQAEAAMCIELLQEEPDAKWPLLTLTRLQEALRTLHDQQNAAGPAAALPAAGQTASRQPANMPDEHSRSDARSAQEVAGFSEDSGHVERDVEEAANAMEKADLSTGQSAYAQLASIDPLRRGYYKDAAAGNANVVLRTATVS